MHVGNMTTLQEIVLTPERKENLEHILHILNVEEQDHRSLSTHSSDEDCRSPLNL